MACVRRNRAMIGVRLRVLFSIKKRREKRIRSSTTHRPFAPFVRTANEFSRKRLSGANRYFVLALPFARAILSYKRSRTIELPVHHRFHLPRTSLLHRAIRSTLGRVDTSHFSRIAHAIYSIIAGRSLAPEKDPQLVSLCMYGMRPVEGREGQGG